jgi:carotenoid cleavage dioxygenase-like enzyme
VNRSAPLECAAPGAPLDSNAPVVSRRGFLRQAGLGAAGLALGCSKDSRSRRGHSTAATSAPVTSGGSVASGQALADTGVRGGATLVSRTPTSLMVSGGLELDVDLEILSGTLPTDLSGHVFVNSARPAGTGTFVFNGDGLIHRIDFGQSRPRLVTRFVKSPCYYADQATKGTGDGFQDNGLARISRSLGARNQGNTAFLPLGPDRLLATYDAGRPWELDPVTLDVATPVGRHSEWRTAMDIPAAMQRFVMGNVFPLVMASAHPVWDSHTQEFFGINFGGNQGLRVLGVTFFAPVFTDLLRWDGSGALERWTLVHSSGQPIKIENSVHQLQVTEDYILVMDCAFNSEPEKLFDPSAFSPQLSDARIYLIRRADLAQTASGGQVEARRVTIPRESAHFFADYANPGGKITVHLQHNCASDASEWLQPSDVEFGSGTRVRQELVGLFAGATDLGVLGRYVIDGPSATYLSAQSVTYSDADWTWTLGLATHPGVWSTLAQHEQIYVPGGGFQADTLIDRVAQGYAGYPHRTVPMNQLPLATGRPASLARFDVRQGKVADGWLFPPGRMACSPQFVPRSGGGATNGYLVVVVLSDDTSWQGSSGDEFWIFDAADLAQGPLCRLAHPQLRMPFTMHTAYMPEIRSRAASYKIDVTSDHQAEVDKLSPALQDMFRTQVYPNF